MTHSGENTLCYTLYLLFGSEVELLISTQFSYLSSELEFALHYNKITLSAFIRDIKSTKFFKKKVNI